MPDAIRLADKLALLNGPWRPAVIADCNGQEVKVVELEGEFVWHAHADADELFLVLSGAMRIELRDGVVELREGELYVVPRGVEHRPVAESRCQVLLFEPAALVNTGDAGGPMTAPARRV